MRKITDIFVHCSATPVNKEFTALSIIKMHQSPPPAGLGWKNPGYHYVIERSGQVVRILSEEKIANGAKGYNSHSVHVCLIGGLNAQMKSENNFTKYQFAALVKLLKSLKEKYGARIRGHNEVAAKDCPCFNVQAFIKENQI